MWNVKVIFNLNIVSSYLAIEWGFTVLSNFISKQQMKLAYTCDWWKGNRFKKRFILGMIIYVAMCSRCLLRKRKLLNCSIFAVFPYDKISKGFSILYVIRSQIIRHTQNLRRKSPTGFNIKKYFAHYKICNCSSK